MQSISQNPKYISYNVGKFCPEFTKTQEYLLLNFCQLWRNVECRMLNIEYGLKNALDPVKSPFGDYLILARVRENEKSRAIRFERKQAEPAGVLSIPTG